MFTEQWRQKLTGHARPNLPLAVAFKDRGNEYACSGRFELAMECYASAIQHNPRYAEAYCNLGYAFALLDDPGDAMAYYRKAIALKPDLVQAHKNLGDTLIEMGLMNEAKESFLKVLALNPGDAAAYYSLGEIAAKQEDYTEAELLLRQATELQPDYADAYCGLGFALGLNNRHSEAVAAYRTALEIEPDHEDAYRNLAVLLIEMGQMNNAEESLTAALLQNPNNMLAINSLLSLISYSPDDSRFSQLETLYANRESFTQKEQINLNFSMGKAMEDIGQFDRSFTAYAEGNLLENGRQFFDEREIEEVTQKSSRTFNARLLDTCAVLEKKLPAAAAARIPIFIVGMPKSGSTLIEQILCSHRCVFGGGELKVMNEIGKQAELVLQSNDAEYVLSGLRRLGKAYLDTVWKFAPDAQFITDKMPGNFMNIGLIHLMLPNAKIIHSVRDPVETCFSCYTQHFSDGNLYSFDLQALGRQYLRYRDLMTHWNNVLPSGRILDVCYEKLVIDQEGEIQRLLNFLELPWDPNCLQFYEKNRVVRTSSLVQVRKPIFLNSISRSKPYLRHLKPLLDTLNRS